MKATYNADAKTKWTTSHRKEGKCFFSSYAIIEPNRDRYGSHKRLAGSTVELRLYGTGNQNFACLWVHLAGNTKTGNPFPNGVYTQGSGRAGGYGYHRPSAAAQEAIYNAGFELSESISGVGDSAIEEALVAIAESLGLSDFILVRSHA